MSSTLSNVNNNKDSNSNQELIITEQVSKNWISKKDVAANFGVNVRTITNIIEELSKESPFLTQSHSKKGGYHNSEVYYDDELIKIIGFKLSTNNSNQNTGAIQKQITNEVKEQGILLAAVSNSGNIEAAQALCNLIMAKTQAVADLQLLQQKNAQLEHALEYDRVKGWKAWNYLKKEIEYKGNFQRLVDEIPLVKDEDYVKKVMGYDKYPTTLISLTGEEKIIDFKECVLDEE